MQLLDKYYNSIKIGDTVSLFGEIGQVNEEMGALGIYFKEGVNWELVKNKLKKWKIAKRHYISAITKHLFRSGK